MPAPSNGTMTGIPDDVNTGDELVVTLHADGQVDFTVTGRHINQAGSLETTSETVQDRLRYELDVPDGWGVNPRENEPGVFDVLVG